jgi:regulatory protein
VRTGSDRRSGKRRCGWNDALRLLTIRERTRRSLVTALVRRRHDRATAVAIVEQLAQAGWVDDGRYARLRLQSAVRSRPESLRILTLRLRQDGCDDETIRAAIADAKERVDGFDDLELARRLVQKKLRTSAPDRQKILRAVRKGFPPGVVQQALRDVDSGPGGEADR